MLMDEHLLADAVFLAHHHVQLAGPGPVMLAEPTVLEAMRLAQTVLLPSSARVTLGSRSSSCAQPQSGSERCSLITTGVGGNSCCSSSASDNEQG